MKLYVIPIQNQCNANCIFCITKYRQEEALGESLKEEDIKNIDNLVFDKIEITGGGEPLLHPHINTIINKLSQISFTQIYTNGLLLSRLKETTLKNLNKLCISRAHYNHVINHKLMKIVSNDNEIKGISNKVAIKMSSVMCSSGINSQIDITEYVKWAISIGAKEVVFRRMFDFGYPPKIQKEVNVDLDKIITEMKKYHSIISEDEEKINFSVLGMPVEIELRSCECELTNLVLRPNGKIYAGWGKNEYQRTP